MQIGLDFDGVIADSSALKIAAARDMFGVAIPLRYLKTEHIQDSGLLTLPQYHELQQYVYTEPRLIRKLPQVTGAKTHIEKLLRDGHTLRIVTSRVGIAEELARQWLTERGILLSLTGVGRENEKTDACKGLDIFVDDDLPKLLPLCDSVPHRFLFGWPYNEHEDPEFVTRVESWEDLYSCIAQLKTPA